jgi:hypothetical protein
MHVQQLLADLRLAGRRCRSDERRIDLVLLHLDQRSAAYGALHAASAIYGFIAVSRCKKLQREVKYDPDGGPTWSPVLKK